MKLILWTMPLAAIALTLGGCIEHRVKTEPIEIKPIHITVDVNVKVDRELDNFFDFEDEYRKPTPEAKQP